MILAQFEAYYSRPIAPTRRVSLGSCDLPVDPAPGFGGILLGAIAARFVPGVDEELGEDLAALVDQLERGRQIAQPRLRHRLQDDKVGLQRCRHRLLGEGERLSLRFEVEKGTPLQHTLCAIYAAGATPRVARSAVMSTIRKGLAWRSDVDDHLIAHLAGRGTGFRCSGRSAMGCGPRIPITAARRARPPIGSRS
jgi:hypothetical protein